MFEAAHKSLPPVDYVSMIRSLYAEPRVMMLGALASALAAGTAGVEAGNGVLIGIAVAFVIVGVARLIDMMAFARTELGDEDVATASKWELRATIGAVSIAVTYGVWSFYSFVFVNTPFSEMSSLAVSVSVLVGVAGRNFAIDRLVSIQVALIGAPLALGMLFDGQIQTAMLSMVLLAFFVSIRQVSANIRAILIKAVHGRLEASRLADELDTALATMHHGLCMLDADGLIAVANGRAEITFSGFAPGSWKGRPFAAMIAAAAGRGTDPAALGRAIARDRQCTPKRQDRSQARRQRISRSHGQFAPGPGGPPVRGHHRTRARRRADQLHGALRCADRPAKPGLFRRTGSIGSRTPSETCASRRQSR